MGTGPRICILTPGALGSNPRVVKEADALHEEGYDVTVISMRTLAHVDRRDDAVLADAGWRALRLDFRSRGMAWRIRRGVQSVDAASFRLTGYRGFADRAWSAFSLPLIAAARRVPAELYIAHYPAALPAAAISARRRGALYAFDAEDFHAGEWPQDEACDRMRLLVRAVEARHLPGCAHVTAASPGIAEAYADTYGIPRPTVLLNVFPRAQAPTHPTPAGAAQPGPSVYWFSQTIGPDRGLECAVRAVARARTRPHLYLRGSPTAQFAERLREIADESGAAAHLHILPPEAPAEMVSRAAGYDVGLVSETGHTPNRCLTLGNKLFTYLLAGVPAVLSDTPAHRVFAGQVGKAARLYAADDPDSLAEELNALLGDPATLAGARATAFRLGQTRFNWDVEKAVLLERISVAVARQARTVRPVVGVSTS
jgi:glycosyltransferase involved in cell wall biosynthesis